MYNCYNEGFNYLLNKCGKRPIQYSCFHNKTTDTYNQENLSKDDETMQVHLLITQYNYGIAAKRELWYKLIELGIIKADAPIN